MSKHVRKLCRIQAFDPDGLTVMNLFAELSDKELRGTSIYLEEMVIRGLIRAYRAELYQERRQMHVQALLMPALFNELEYLAKIMNMVNRPGMSGKYDRLGPKDWSPIDEVTQHIAEQIARAFFVSAWASAREERGQSFSQQNLYDVAPETPDYVQKSAMELIRAMERLNKMPMRKMYEQALERDELIDAPDIRDDFGFLTAMQALGYGVRWTDSHKDHGLKVPWYQFSEEDLHGEDIENEGLV